MPRPPLSSLCNVSYASDSDDSVDGRTPKKSLDSSASFAWQVPMKTLGSHRVYLDRKLAKEDSCTRALIESLHTKLSIGHHTEPSSNGSPSAITTTDRSGSTKSKVNSRMDLPSSWVSPRTGMKADLSIRELLGRARVKAQSERLDRAKKEEEIVEYIKQFKNTCSELLTELQTEGSVPESLPYREQLQTRLKFIAEDSRLALHPRLSRAPATSDWPKTATREQMIMSHLINAQMEQQLSTACERISAHSEALKTLKTSHDVQDESGISDDLAEGESSTKAILDIWNGISTSAIRYRQAWYGGTQALKQMGETVQKTDDETTVT